MNTAKKEFILKLIDKLPENKVGEIIDFLEYLQHKQEQELLLDNAEEKELWNLVENDERVSSEEVEKLIQGE